MIIPQDRVIVDALKTIVKRHGKEIAGSPERFCALINDYVTMLDRRAEKELLYRACKQGVAEIIANSPSDKREYACRRGLYILTVENFIADEWASRVISWLSAAFDESADNEYQNDKKEEREHEEQPDFAVASLSELLLNANFNGNVILLNGRGEETEFEKVGSVEHQGSIYFLLRPLEDVPGVMLGEVMVFSFREEFREAIFALVTDQQILNDVLKKYTGQK